MRLIVEYDESIDSIDNVLTVSLDKIRLDKKRKEYTYQDLSLGLLLKHLIKKNNPKAKWTCKQVRDWAADISLMVRKDEREYKDIEEIKEIIKESGLKTIEDYTGKSTDFLEKIKPGITTEFNALAGRLIKTDLTKDEFIQILKEASQKLK